MHSRGKMTFFLFIKLYKLIIILKVVFFFSVLHSLFKSYRRLRRLTQPWSSTSGTLVVRDVNVVI